MSAVLPVCVMCDERPPVLIDEHPLDPHHTTDQLAAWLLASTDWGARTLRVVDIMRRLAPSALRTPKSAVMAAVKYSSDSSILGHLRSRCLHGQGSL